MIDENDLHFGSVPLQEAYEKIKPIVEKQKVKMRAVDRDIKSFEALISSLNPNAEVMIELDGGRFLSFDLTSKRLNIIHKSGMISGVIQSDFATREEVLRCLPRLLDMAVQVMGGS